MFSKPTTLTLNAAQLFLALLPTEPDSLQRTISHISIDLGLFEPDCIDLIRRCMAPGEKPVFDGIHVEADWYNNNIQIPRLLVSLADQLGIVKDIPDHYAIEPRLFDCLEQSRFFINAYVKQQTVLLKCLY